jgi:transposase InsO family protein
MTADLVTDVRLVAWFRRKPEPGVVFHSDRGSSSPIRFLQDWLGKQAGQQSRAA